MTNVRIFLNRLNLYQCLTNGIAIDIDNDTTQYRYRTSLSLKRKVNFFLLKSVSPPHLFILLSIIYPIPFILLENECNLSLQLAVAVAELTLKIPLRLFKGCSNILIFDPLVLSPYSQNNGNFSSHAPLCSLNFKTSFIIVQNEQSYNNTIR